MEIRIKTAEEFWRDKVSIEITGTAAEVQAVGERVWTPVSEIRAMNAKVDELERQLATAQQAREIETRERLKAEGQAREWDRDRHTERDRADRAERDLAESRELVEAKNEVIEALQDNFATSAAEVRRLKEEVRQRFTATQVEDAKAGAREDARAAMDREVVKPLDAKLAEAEQGLQALADLVGKINGLALGNEVRRALEYLPAEPGTYAHTVSVALRRIRELLGVSWGGPGTPREV